MKYIRLDQPLALSVSKSVPGFKKPCLMIMQGNVAWKVATFTNAEMAEEFEQFMDKFLKPWIGKGGGM